MGKLVIHLCWFLLISNLAIVYGQPQHISCIFCTSTEQRKDIIVSTNKYGSYCSCPNLDYSKLKVTLSYEDWSFTYVWNDMNGYIDADDAVNPVEMLVTLDKVCIRKRMSYSSGGIDGTYTKWESGYEFCKNDLNTKMYLPIKTICDNQCEFYEGKFRRSEEFEICYDS